MNTIYDVLGIAETDFDFLSDDEIQEAYKAWAARYHPDDDLVEIQIVSAFLRDADLAIPNEAMHRLCCVNALKTLALDDHKLPLETLEILSATLLNDKQMAVREACCHTIAFSCSDRYLSPGIIQALEQVLEHEDETLGSIAASALELALKSDQLLAKNSVQYVESAFIRHENKQDISLFLFELVEKNKDQALSLATYELLSQIILDANQTSETQDHCYDILATCARNGQCIPGLVFEALSAALSKALDNPKSSSQDLAFYCYVLMACFTQEKNRLDIAPEVFTKIISLLQQVLFGQNFELSKYAAAIIGHLVDDASQSVEAVSQLFEIMEVSTGPNKQQEVFLGYLVELLEAKDSKMWPYAVLPLHHLLSQDGSRDKKYGLEGDALCALGEIINDAGYDLELRKQAIAVMGYSARNNKNAFMEDELGALAGVLKKKNPALTEVCLVTLSYHPNNLADYRVRKQVIAALNHADTSIAAMNFLKTVVEEAREQVKALIWLDFLPVAKTILLEKAAVVSEEFLDDVVALLAKAHENHPDEVQEILDAMEDSAYESASDDQEDEPAQDLENPEDLEESPSENPVSERTLDQLFAELDKDKRNEDNPDVLQLLKEGTLKQQLAEITEASEKDSLLLRTEISDVSEKDSVLPPIKKTIKPIKEWDEEDILRWSKAIKNQPQKAQDPKFLAEIIAVISRGNVLATKQEPRATQLISLLLLLDAKNTRRLAEIATGEGKSTIVAMLAAIKALQGDKVDVVTSSPVLAFRDAQAKAKFFKLFDLTATSNWHPDDDPKMRPGFKACYAADIVYGDANNFQSDLLREEYKLENTRGKRPYKTVIVDEVDSMFIDESQKILSLGSHKPLMAELETIFISAWIHLCKRKHELSVGEVTLSMDEDTGSTMTESKHLSLLLEHHFKTAITDTDSPGLSATTTRIPKHLHAYVLSQAPHWAHSAVLASETFAEGKDYIFTKEGEHKIIAPVDYLNTGMVHANSAWDDALHQFLQLKHGIKFTAENLTASFISNMAFFKRYAHIYGLTGTLGAKDAQDLLKEVYDLDLAFVPTYIKKDFKEVPGILAKDFDEWLVQVVNSVKKEVDKGRAALVICETINKVRAVEDALKKANIHNVSCYTRSDNDESAVISEKIGAKKVIAATNLAGRGTDISTTDEVEKNGGLYVCVTFMPSNLRIEDQAFGRTSRQGNKGSAQLIVNKQETVARLVAQYPDLGDVDDADTMENLKAWRNRVEKRTLQLVKEFELKKLEFKDALFDKFCKFTHKLRDLADEDTMPEEVNCKLEEVEEQWGFWLKNVTRDMAKKRTVDEKEVLDSFEVFKRQIEHNYIHGSLQNPAQWVKLGNQYSQDAKKFSLAQAAYLKAIELEPHAVTAANAHYGLGHYYRAQKNNQAAWKELKKARSVLNEHVIPKLEADLQMLHYVNQNQTMVANIEQVQRRIIILRSTIGRINGEISFFKNAKREVLASGVSLGSMFDENNIPLDEIQELNNLGLPRLYNLQEKQEETKKKSGFGAWIRRGLVVIAGICQIVIGACLTATGNTYAGKMLIDMGVSDIIYAIRSAVEGTACNWRDYKFHKIVSTAIIWATMSMNYLRDSAAAKNAAKNTAKEAVKTAVKETAKSTAGNTVFTAAVKTQILQAVQSGVIREAILIGFDRIAKGVIANYKEEIEDSVRSTLLNRFNRPDFQQQIDKILAVDAENGNDHYAKLLNQIAFKLIHPKQNAFASMAESIFKGIANQVPVLGTALKVADIVRAIEKITSLCDDFCDEFSAKLSHIVHKLPPLKGPARSSDELKTQRDNLYNGITEQITHCIMAYLRNETVAPLGDLMMGDCMHKLVTDALTPAKPKPPKKLPEMMSVAESLSIDPNSPEMINVAESLAVGKMVNVPGEAAPSKKGSKANARAGTKKPAPKSDQKSDKKSDQKPAKMQNGPENKQNQHCPKTVYEDDVNQQTVVGCSNSAQTPIDGSLSSPPAKNPAADKLLGAAGVTKPLMTPLPSGPLNPMNLAGSLSINQMVSPPSATINASGPAIKTGVISHTAPSVPMSANAMAIAVALAETPPNPIGTPAQAAAETGTHCPKTVYQDDINQQTVVGCSNSAQTPIDGSLSSRLGTKSVADAISDVARETGQLRTPFSPLPAVAQTGEPSVLGKLVSLFIPSAEAAPNSINPLPKSEEHTSFFDNILAKISDTLNFNKQDDFTDRRESSGAHMIPIFSVNTGKAKSAENKIHFLYRGSSGLPAEVFDNGFSARGNNTDLRAHALPSDTVYTIEDSAYISTSTSKSAAANFPRVSKKNELFLYQINPQPQAIDVLTALEPYKNQIDASDWGMSVRGEGEKAVPYKIRPQDIKGAWTVKLSSFFETEGVGPFTQRKVTKTFIPNPNYRLPLDVQIFQYAKMLSQAATAAGAIVDGVSLFNAYMDSLKSNNYDILGLESARIAGGWSGAFAVGSRLAAASAEMCVPFGPYGPPVCGVVGGLAGSVLGYMGGGSFATEIYGPIQNGSLTDFLFSNPQKTDGTSAIGELVSLLIPSAEAATNAMSQTASAEMGHCPKTVYQDDINQRTVFRCADSAKTPPGGFLTSRLDRQSVADSISGVARDTGSLRTPFPPALEPMNLAGSVAINQMASSPSVTIKPSGSGVQTAVVSPSTNQMTALPVGTIATILTQEKMSKVAACEQDPACQLLRIVPSDVQEREGKVQLTGLCEPIHSKVLVKDKNRSILEENLLQSLNNTIEQTQRLLICQEENYGHTCDPINLPAPIVQNILHFLKAEHPVTEWRCQDFIRAAHGFNFTPNELTVEKQFYIPYGESQPAPGDAVALLDSVGRVRHYAIYLADDLFLSKYGGCNRLEISKLNEMHTVYGTDSSVLLRPIAPEDVSVMRNWDKGKNGIFKEPFQLAPAPATTQSGQTFVLGKLVSLLIPSAEAAQPATDTPSRSMDMTPVVKGLQQTPFTLFNQARDAALPAAGAGMFADGMRFFNPLVSHTTNKQGVNSILRDGVRLESHPSNLFGGKAFYVAQEGFSALEVEGTRTLAYSLSRKIKIYDTSESIPVRTRSSEYKKALNAGFDAIKYEGQVRIARGRYYMHPDPTFSSTQYSYNLAIISDPNQHLKPIGVYSIPETGVSSMSAMSVPTIRVIQGLGLAGTAVAVGHAGYEIMNSDTPWLESAHQASLLGAAYYGGMTVGGLAIQPCSALGAAFPPAAAISVPSCIAAASLVGGALAATGADLTWGFGADLLGVPQDSESANIGDITEDEYAELYYRLGY